MRYILPVLWMRMTSCYYIMGAIARRVFLSGETRKDNVTTKTTTLSWQKALAAAAIGALVYMTNVTPGCLYMKLEIWNQLCLVTLILLALILFKRAITVFNLAVYCDLCD